MSAGDWICSKTGLRDNVEIIIIGGGLVLGFVQAMSVGGKDNFDKMFRAFWRTIGVGLGVIVIITMRRLMWK